MANATVRASASTTYLDNGSTQFTLRASHSDQDDCRHQRGAHGRDEMSPSARSSGIGYRPVSRKEPRRIYDLVDTLPTGMSLLDLSQVMVSWSADADVLEDASLAGADNDAVPPSFVLPSGRISVVGQTITFDLGTLVNQDDDAGAETVTLEFNALVGNVAGNVNNTSLSNQFVVSVNGTNLATSKPGDRHRAHTFGRQLHEDDRRRRAGGRGRRRAVPSDLLQHRDGHGVRQPRARRSRELAAHAEHRKRRRDASAAAPPGIVDASDSDTLDITIIGSIPVGGSVTIDYAATVTSAITPLQAVTNTASLAYTSLPGANGTTVNCHRQLDPRHAGIDDGRARRLGRRDQQLSSARAAARSTRARRPYSKSIASTSIAETASSSLQRERIPDVAIGETVDLSA
jgi:hypothetical protein